MAINLSVQYSCGFLPDIIMPTLCYYHRGTQLNAMKRFCLCSLRSHFNVLTFPPPLSGGCSEALDAFSCFFKKTGGTTVDYSFPSDSTTKLTYQGPQGPVLDGIPLDQLGIEGINNNNALPLTMLAAVTFTPDMSPVDTNPVGHRSSAHSLESAPILPNAVVVGLGRGGGGAFGHWMAF